MLILGIDTATDQVGVALGSDVGIRGEVRLGRGRRHAEELAPAVEGLLRSADASLGDLAAVAVGIGPGLFTGLRVGVTTAKVLAQALAIPVVPIASLDLVAYPLRFSDRTVVALLDARRGELYHARYLPVPGGLQRVSDYAVGHPDDVVAELVATGEELLLAGDGALAYRETLRRVDRTEFAPATFAWPSPAALVELAAERFRLEEFVRPVEVEPLYLRKSDAEIAWDARSGAR